jgi:hypothetical protein
MQYVNIHTPLFRVCKLLILDAVKAVKRARWFKKRYKKGYKKYVANYFASQNTQRLRRSNFI